MKKKGEVIPEKYDWIVWGSVATAVITAIVVAVYNWVGIMLNNVNLIAK